MMAKLVAGAGMASAALMFSCGIAAAAPNVEAIVNSTCTYPQVMSALNAQAPDVANQFETNSMASGWLQQLMSSPPDGRRAMVAQLQGWPQLDEYTNVINNVAGSCQNY